MSEHAAALLESFGPLSAGMAWHILLMNGFAPAAVWIVHVAVPRTWRVRGLASATIVQLLLLWGWHAPGVLASAMERPVLHLAMQLSLAAAAIWFWAAVADSLAVRPWRPITALLFTSKLFCLLGVLLTFAGRLIYPPLTHHGMLAGDAMADQQLAGLLMLIACPLTYLVAAVVIASRWLLASADPASYRREGVEIA